MKLVGGEIPLAGYSYVAIDAYGKEIKGKMEAPDQDRVYHTLKAEGMFPVTIKQLGILQKDINIQLSNPIKPRDLSVFTRQFVSILMPVCRLSQHWICWWNRLRIRSFEKPSATR